MEHDTAGDPVSSVKWTRRTTEKVADELASAGIDVCPNTVGKLLKGLGYRLCSNAKKLNRQKGPGRDAQFAYIAAEREAFAKAGLPVVSVDAKHREMVGELRNRGATWEKEPALVLDHDFLSDATGVALPYGVYDLAANHACVSVDHPRHPWFRRRQPSQVVGAPRLCPLPGSHRASHLGRLRWQQRGTLPSLEARPPAPPVRPLWPHGHCLPLPKRCLQVQPNRYLHRISGCLPCS